MKEQYSRREFVSLALSGLGLLACNPKFKKSSEPYNVIFIIVDDLRPYLGCYGNSFVSSPNIDALAQSGFVFRNAYSQASNCPCSRASIFTGLYPTRNRFTNFGARMDSEAPDVPTLPEYARVRGINTSSLGKVFHSSRDRKASWDRSVFVINGDSGFPGYVNHSSEIKLPKKDGADKFVFQATSERVADADVGKLYSEQLTQLVEEQLSTYAQNEKQFFLSVGYRDTHLPYVLPSRFFEQYQNIELPLLGPKQPPENFKKIFLVNSNEFRAYKNIPAQGPFPLELQQELQRSYLASVSYLDSLIGRILAKLENSGLRQRTAVVLTSDHGISLGENGYFGKGTLYPEALHVPLIIHVPGVDAGRDISSVVGLVDLYPTIAELLHLEKPLHVEGSSLMPLIKGGAEQTAFAHSYACHGTLAETAIGEDFQYIRGLPQDDNQLRQAMFRLKPPLGFIENPKGEAKTALEYAQLTKLLDAKFGLMVK